MAEALNNDYALPVQTQVTGTWTEDEEDAVWTYASANAAGNTFTVYRSGDVTAVFAPYVRIRAKQGAGYQYFITHAVSAYDDINDRTTLTLFAGTESTLTDTAITDVAFSWVRLPFGFPVGEDKWSVEFLTATEYSYSGTGLHNVYTLATDFTITLPAGLWDVSYHVFFDYFSTNSSTTQNRITTALNDGSYITDSKRTFGWAVTTNDRETIYQDAKFLYSASSEITLQFYFLVFGNNATAITVYINPSALGTFNSYIRAVSAYY